MNLTSETASFLLSYIAMAVTPITQGLSLNLSLFMQHEDNCTGHMTPDKHQTCIHDPPVSIVSALPPRPLCFTRPRGASTLAFHNAIFSY